MGAAQTYQWITQFPDFMDLAIPFCGSARTSLHNCVFLEGVKSALLAAKGLNSNGSGVQVLGGKGKSRDAWSEEEKTVGLKAFGRAYAGWYVEVIIMLSFEDLTNVFIRGFSQAFYREKLHEKHFGSPDLESFLIDFWEAWACSKGPSNSCSPARSKPHNADTKHRPGEHARYATDMAKWRLLASKTLRWGL